MFKVQNRELTGFGLGGYVQLNGTIKIEGSNRFIGEWPKEITLLDNTYTLESVEDGNVDPETGIKWQNAEYV